MHAKSHKINVLERFVGKSSSFSFPGSCLGTPAERLHLPEDRQNAGPSVSFLNSGPHLKVTFRERLSCSVVISESWRFVGKRSDNCHDAPVCK
jgi:hypothetical protein